MSNAQDSPEGWGRASRGYSEKVAPVLMSSFTTEFAERLELSPDTKVIEVGAGSGALTEKLFPMAKSVHATDYSEAMIDVLSERMQALGADNVTYGVMDGQNLEVSDNSYDASASSFAIMLFPDRSRGFAELCRVTKPGGRALVSGWSTPDKFEALGMLFGAMRVAFPDMPPPETPPPVFSLADPGQFKSEMQASGFKSVDVELVSRELTIANSDVMWEMLTIGAPPIQALFEKIGESGKTKLRETLVAMLVEKFGQGEIVLNNEATVAVGIAT